MTIAHRRSVLPWAMEIATATAQRSRDPSLKVGCVILRPDKSIVSVGYNGFPRATPDREEWYSDRAEKYDRIVHAEMNAILQARESVLGYVLVVTVPCCKDCTKHIIAAGIARVAWAKPSEDYLSRWGDQVERSKQLLEEAGVEWIEYDGAASKTAGGSGSQAA